MVRLVNDGRASQSAALAAEQQRVREIRRRSIACVREPRLPWARSGFARCERGRRVLRRCDARASCEGGCSRGSCRQRHLRTWRQRGQWHLRVVRMTLVPHVAWPLRRVRIERLRWLTLNGRLIRLSRNGGVNSDEARAVRGSGEVRPRSASSTAAPRERGRRYLLSMRPTRRLCEMFRRVVRMWSRDTVGRRKQTRLVETLRFARLTQAGRCRRHRFVARAARASVDVASSPRLGAFSSAPWKTRALRDLTSERRR